MPEIKYERVTPEYIKYFSENMRQCDVLEVLASDGHSPAEAVQVSVDSSDYKGVLTIDGDPVLIYGLKIISNIPSVGVIWALGTDSISKNKRAFIVGTGNILEDMATVVDNMVNMVDCRNKESIRWLKALGAIFSEPEPLGINGELFSNFCLRAEQCVASQQ